MFDSRLHRLKRRRSTRLSCLQGALARLKVEEMSMAWQRGRLAAQRSTIEIDQVRRVSISETFRAMKLFAPCKSEIIYNRERRARGVNTVVEVEQVTQS